MQIECSCGLGATYDESNSFLIIDKKILGKVGKDEVHNT